MWQPVLMINGYVVFVLGAMMLLPAAAEKYYVGAADFTFIESAFTAMFLGGMLFFANYGKIKNISVLQGYLITITCWFVAPIVAALPLYQNGDVNTLADALFEASSGITATGATILKNVEAQPKSVLLWRSMLSSLGGVGIVIFAVALMPFLGIGGLKMFKNENSDTEDKFMPKFRYIAKDIILIYIILNMVCVWLLKLAGMNWFDALNHALATVCTGGFSTKNNSIAYFNSVKIEAVISLFMLLGAMPMTYFILLIKKKKISYICSNPQVNALVKLVFLYTLCVSFFYAGTEKVSVVSAFRVVWFNIVSAITTTGFTSDNFLSWGSWAVGVFLILILHGGCTGSSSGSIKIFRWQVVSAFFKKNAVKSLSPNQIVVMKTGDKIIDDNIVNSVFMLIFGFLFAISLFTLILSLSGLDFLTALGAVAGAITSFGPGMTEATGPIGNYAAFSPFAKYILAFVMVLGRLEVVSFIVLFSKIKLR